MVLNSLMSEIYERGRRAKNVILFNLKEAANSEDDLRLTNDLLRRNSLPNCCSVQRLGSANGREPRPLRGTFETKDDALLVLKNRKKLLELRISVDGDKTINRRNHLRDTRMELDRRITEGEKDLTIKYVDGIPTILPKQQKKRIVDGSHNSSQRNTSSSSNSTFMVYYQNVRGLRTKLPSLRESFATSSTLPDVFIFTETWLTEVISDAEQGLKGYNIYRFDRSLLTSSCLRGGGVLIVCLAGIWF